MGVARVPARPSAVVAVLAVLSLLLASCGGAPNRSRAETTSAASTSSAGPTPSRDAAPTPDEIVEQTLAGLDRRAQVAQLFVIGVRLDDLDSGDALAEAGVGGLFMAGRSQAPADDLAAVTERWQSVAPGPGLWVAVDQEGGAVQTLKGEGFDLLPTAREQGDLPADELAALAAGMGSSLDAAGVNLDLAPVVDVVPPGTEADNAPIGAFGREYGGTPEEVTAAAGTIVAGLADSGVTATLKHFPGLGRVAGNTDDTPSCTTR